VSSLNPRNPAPKEIGHKLTVAKAAMRLGRLAEADRICRTVLEAKPQNLKARVLLARTALCRCAAAAAANQLATVVKRDPTAFRSLLMLSAAHKRREDHAKALIWARKAADLKPDDIGAIVWNGLCCLELDQFQEAERRFRAALDIAEDRADIHNWLGLALQGQGRYGDATDSFEMAAEINPSSPVFRRNLTESLISENDLTALDSARTLIELCPNDPTGHMMCAECLVGENLSVEAEAEARTATSLGPYEAIPFATLGSILMALGKMDEAQTQCEHSIDLEPRQGLAYFNLVRGRRIGDPDRPLVERMIELSQDKTMHIGQQSLLAYGLGKALEDLGDFEQSMQRFEEANRLDHRRKFGETTFDMEQNRAAFDLVKRRYGLGLVSEAEDHAKQTELPIFVFGMMRSGTTLLEQILSSHPDIGAAGEQRFWVKNRTAPFVRQGGGLDKAVLDALSEDYASILRRIAPGKRFVIDKMPTNYMQVGLLHLAFPNACLIHIRRHPIDTCLSIFTTHNRVPIPWANHKHNIAVNYQRYDDLMRHWQNVLPEGRMLEVRYEELVSNPKPVIEQILARCGLDWSDSCLHPERNERCVATPSIWQVRQPIYTSSVARWRKFEPWLGDLAQLKDETDR
jgi:tetratricopeptide (TPR) repeat protein